MQGEMIFSDKRVALHAHKGYISTIYAGNVRELDRIPAPDYFDTNPWTYQTLQII